MTKTPEEARAWWAEQLRSERFLQGKNKLRRITPDGLEDGRPECCCLGVASELAIEDGVSLVVEVDDDIAAYRYDGEKDFLPVAVREWLGLGFATSSPSMIIDQAFVDWYAGYDEVSDTRSFGGPYFVGQRVSLALLNDDEVPFDAIAGLIERGCWAEGMLA